MKTNGIFSSNSDEWTTPKELFNELNNEFNFTLDAASTIQNSKCDKFFTQKEDGLKQSWGGSVYF